MLIISGTSDNEPSNTLSVDQYLNFSGRVRCVCHSLSHVLNGAVKTGNFTAIQLKKINSTTAYLNRHKNIKAKLFEMQFREYGKDRAASVENLFHTRWPSKLSIYDKYIRIMPLLVRVLDIKSPPIPTSSDEKGIAGFIDVFEEVRRVARALDKDR